MIVAIEVTIEDVVDGVPESECTCAVALAMKRALPGRDVEVYNDEFYVDGIGIKAPEIAAKFIVDFDHYQKPDPISFEIEVPEAAS